MPGTAELVTKSWFVPHLTEPSNNVHAGACQKSSLILFQLIHTLTWNDCTWHLFTLAKWLHTYAYKCMKLDSGLSLASVKPVPSETQTSQHAHWFHPHSPSSATPNFSLLCSVSDNLNCVCSLCLPLFAGAGGFHQLFRNYVARLSQLQGEPPPVTFLWRVWLWSPLI